MTEPLIRAIGLSLAGLLALYSVYRRDSAPMVILAVFGPLSYFAVRMGVVFQPAELIGMVFLLFIAFRPEYIKILKARYVWPFVVFYAYTVVLTYYMMPWWPEYAAGAQGDFYGKWMRGQVQVLQVAIGLAIVIMLVQRVRRREDLYNVQAVTLACMSLISIYGMYVWYAQQAGLPFNSITRMGGALVAEAPHRIRALVDGTYVVRAYSLTGEPRSLASNAVLGLTLVLFSAAGYGRWFRTYLVQVGLVVLFLITLYYTYSTAGYLMFVLAMSTGFLVFVVTGQFGRRVWLRNLAILVFVGGLAVGFWGAVSGEVASSLEHRVTGRLAGEGIFTYAEVGITQHFRDVPMHAVTGVGLGGSHFFVRLYDQHSYPGSIAAPRGLVGFIGDRGVIGLLLFGFAFVRAWLPVARFARSRRTGGEVYGGIAVMSAVCFILMMTSAGWYLEWFTVGVLAAAAGLAERQSERRRDPDGERALIVKEPSMRRLARL